VIRTVIVVLAVAVLATSSWAATPLFLDPGVLDGQSVPFIEHTSSARFGSYLSMHVPYEPVRRVWTQLETALGRPLRHRGEAHVTVITPPEYEDGLASHLSIHDINAIARRRRIQHVMLDVVCLGSGTVKLDGVDESTFYLVVQAPELVDLRREVHRVFVARGGAPTAFDPTNYHPHVTVGFTRRDLHESDGVVKDARSADGRFTLDMSP